MSPYKDVDWFRKQYEDLAISEYGAYSKLREESLTAKFALEDYGISLAVVGFLGLLVSLRHSFLHRSPPAFFGLGIISILLPVLNAGGYVYGLEVAWARGEFPHWADNIGLGLILVPPLFAIEFIWSLIHFLALNGADHPSTSLRLAFSFRTCWWFLVLAMYCAVLVTLALAFGCYWFAIPNLCWLYYYLSLSAVYRVEYGAPRCQIGIGTIRWGRT